LLKAIDSSGEKGELSEEAEVTYCELFCMHFPGSKEEDNEKLSVASINQVF
jgi:hypothetical protein